jgi:HSP20 family molecular chaperone IbpA
MTNNRSITRSDDSETSPSATERVERRPVLRPRTDIIETESGILVRADMPGVEEKQLEITIEKNTLRIRGAIAETEGRDAKTTLREFEPVDYERAFILSNEVDREKIAARLKHGVLELILPKGEYAQTRKIPISVD